jgi:DNA-binding LytR/AlgR family response regulator
MPQINGVELIKSLTIQPPFIIFITAFKDFAIEGYNLNATDYILKPVSFDRFLKAINKVRAFSINRAQNDIHEIFPALPYRFFKDGNTLVKVMLADILYIEGLKDYIQVVTKERKIVTYMRMKSLEIILPSDTFLRIHKSYILNIAAIKTITGNLVEIINGDEIAIAKQYRQSLNDTIGIQ